MSERRIVAVLLAGVVAVSAALAGSDGSFIYRPASVSFAPPLSTNGMEGGNVSTGFSLNIVGGYLGQLRGVELGGVFNVERAGVSGCQAAGAVNVVGGSVTGAQLAGAVNITGADVRGVQAAGAVNVAGEGICGAQLAGAVNIAGGISRGVQAAGAVNIAEEFEGAQVGVVNIAGKGKGLQLGVVNIADDIDYPIGLVSIVKNGQFHLNAWASEFAAVNLGIKAGSKSIYNVFAVGVAPAGDSTRVFAALGIGGHIPLDRFFLDIDGVYYSPRMGPEWFEEEGSDLLTGVRVTGGWQVNDYLALTAGPTVNVWVSDDSDGSNIPFYDLPLFHHEGKTNVRIWPGFTVGLQLL